MLPVLYWPSSSQFRKWDPHFYPWELSWKSCLTNDCCHVTGWMFHWRPNVWGKHSCFLIQHPLIHSVRMQRTSLNLEPCSSPRVVKWRRKWHVIPVEEKLNWELGGLVWTSGYASVMSCGLDKQCPPLSPAYLTCKMRMFLKVSLGTFQNYVVTGSIDGPPNAPKNMTSDWGIHSEERILKGEKIVIVTNYPVQVGVKFAKGGGKILRVEIVRKIHLGRRETLVLAEGREDLSLMRKWLSFQIPGWDRDRQRWKWNTEDSCLLAVDAISL